MMKAVLVRTTSCPIPATSASLGSPTRVVAFSDQDLLSFPGRNCAFLSTKPALHVHCANERKAASTGPFRRTLSEENLHRRPSERGAHNNYTPPGRGLTRRFSRSFPEMIVEEEQNVPNAEAEEEEEEGDGSAVVLKRGGLEGLGISDRLSGIWSVNEVLPEEKENEEEEEEECELTGGGTGEGRKDGGGRGGARGGDGIGDLAGGSADQNKMGVYYQELLKADPGNPLLLRNYGKYLHEVERDTVKAEEYYGRAILASPGDGEVLSLYGKLVWETQRDEGRAQAYFDQAIKASPDDCYVLGSYAHFLWDAEEEEGEEEKGDVEVELKSSSSMVAAF